MKKSFEPIVLAATLALLALVAAGLAYTFPDVPTLTGVPSLEPNGHVPKPVKADELTASLAPLATPQVWNKPASNSRLFLSDVYLFYPSLYPNGSNYIQKDDGTARTPGGILISWCRKYHLDITDPNIEREDPDGDGFSNKTEFMAGTAIGATNVDGSMATNPLDPKSHPTYLSRLRLSKVDIRPFHIKFVGVVNLNGQNVFQIQLMDIPETQRQPPLKHTGDDLGYEGWIVGPYTPKMVQEMDPNTHAMVTKDESTLELDKPDIGRKVVLPLRSIINSPESTAHFQVLMPDQRGDGGTPKEILVPSGKTFALPEQPNLSYLFVEASDDPKNDPGATIRDTKGNQEIKVPMLMTTPTNEWDDVPTSANASPAANSH